MKLLLVILINICVLQSQNQSNKNWEELTEKDMIYITVTAKTQKFKVTNFTFESVWDSKQNYSKNIGFYGGIKALKVYRDKKPLITIYKIEDALALGEIYFEFYDYNFDGDIDFSVPMDSGKGIIRKYYLFNKELNQFKHYKDWDGIGIDAINPSKKQIKSNDAYNALHGTNYIYQVSGYKLRLIEKLDY